ncbi:MAG: hypothetical protein HYW89_01460 [Candidatus Sungiibacteriota bacterium]|uniref:Uncharacterized protein n=1 Tax=Candidatus Sungiibacteriota bacterium TaxID=2750080 RepID=A0A7T5RK17_9BACT|nr:MAG: hypothetical protein HYW89_01460 [Candidatus Sungbacteria bacterium]
MNSHEYKKIIIYTSVVVFLAVGFLLFFLWLGNSVREASENIKKTKAGIVLLEEERKSARVSTKFLEDRVKDFSRIEAFTVDRERPVAFIEFLEGMAKKTNNLMALDFDEIKSKGKALFFRVTIDGSESSTRQYLRLLELAPFEIRPEELIFQKLGRETTASSKTIGPASRIILLISVRAL